MKWRLPTLASRHPCSTSPATSTWKSTRRSPRPSRLDLVQETTTLEAARREEDVEERQEGVEVSCTSLNSNSSSSSRTCCRGWGVLLLWGRRRMGGAVKARAGVAPLRAGRVVRCLLGWDRRRGFCGGKLEL